jgi:hypothetical protein
MKFFAASEAPKAARCALGIWGMFTVASTMLIMTSSIAALVLGSVSEF